jgi:hypothetical protein
VLENQIDQAERRATLRNDLKIREQQQAMHTYAPNQSLPRQAATMHQFALAEAATPRGRYSDVDATYVVGSKPDISGAYHAASAHQRDPCGQEPALGYRVDDLNPSDPVEVSSLPQQQTGEPTERTPSPPLADVESGNVGSPSLSRRTYRRF